MINIIIWTVTIALATWFHHRGVMIGWVIVVIGYGMVREMARGRDGEKERGRDEEESKSGLLRSSQGPRSEGRGRHVLWKNIGGYVLMIVLGLLVVMRYDMVSEMVGHPGRVFQITQYGRSGRYEATSYPDASYDIIIRSQQSLSLGDIVRVRDRFYERTYSPEWCFWVCDHGKLSDGQSRQVVDNESHLGLMKFDYHRWLYMKGIDGTVYDDYVQVIDTQPHGLHHLKNNLRHIVTRLVDERAMQALWLGMTIGDRSLFDDDIYQGFVDSGLVHLVAVSGGNIAIVVLFVSMLLFRLPFYLRQMMIIIAIIGYAMIVGTDSSVVRATIMGLLTVIALFPGRQIDVWRSMAIAWILMLVWNPYFLIADLGFLLSFGALSGIIRTARRRERLTKILWGDEFQSLAGQHKMTKGSHQSRRVYLTQWREYVLRLYVVPSVGALIGVIPILMIGIGKVNLVGPIANVLVVPLVTGVTMVGGVTMGIGLWVTGSGLRVEGMLDMMVWLLEGMLGYIIWWADWAQRYAVWMVWS